jgi:hypothetical protein
MVRPPTLGTVLSWNDYIPVWKKRRQGFYRETMLKQTLGCTMLGDDKKTGNNRPVLGGFYGQSIRALTICVGVRVLVLAGIS